MNKLSRKTQSHTADFGEAPAGPGDPIQLTLVEAARKAGRQDRLLDGRLVLSTPHGLHPLDRLLIEAGADLPAPRIMSVALGNAMPAVALGALKPEAEVVFFHHDLFYVNQAELLATGHRLRNFTSLCQPSVAAVAPRPNLILMALRRDGEAGLTCELIRQAHAALACGGKLLAAINNIKDQWLRRQLERVFGNLTVAAKNKAGLLYSVKRTDRPAPVKSATPEVATGEPETAAIGPELEGIYIKHVPVCHADLELTFETCYGTFSSDGLDDGSRALLEVMVPPEPCRSILDLGCGWGGMGVLAARRTGAERLTMIDANARAVAMARCNAASHGPAGTEVRLESDTESLRSGTEAGQYDAVISNPPYATEFRVTEMFIQAAFRALRPGGRVWLVGKANEHMARRVEETFGNMEILKRRGYAVVTAERPDSRRFS